LSKILLHIIPTIRLFQNGLCFHVVILPTPQELYFQLYWQTFTPYKHSSA